MDLCIRKAFLGGVKVAIRDLKRSGRPNIITADDKAWVISLACAKPTDYGYAAEKWTHSQLAKYVRESAETSRHPALRKAVKATVQRILKEHEIKPHKTSYYLDRRDPEFEEKMAQVLYVYKEIEVFRQTPEKKENRQETTVSYDEKLGIQAIANIAADLAPVPHQYATWRATMNTSATARSALWPALIFTTATFMLWSEIDTEVGNLLNSWKR